MLKLTFIPLVFASIVLVACGEESTSTSSSSAGENSPATESAGNPVDGPAAETSSGPSTKKSRSDAGQSKEPGAGPMPVRFKGIQELLAGASDDKEPSNMEFNANSDPIIALRWFSRHSSEDKERVFALRALGLYPTPQNYELLLTTATNDKEKPAIRAGALLGLGRYDLEADQHVKAKELIFALVNGKDLQLATAAAEAMHGMPTAQTVLTELSSNSNTPPALKAAAKRALRPQVE